MEEAEALSTKMAIMTRGTSGGKFSCFGSSQHIKNKFATGYEIEIKIRKAPYADLEQFKNDIGFSQQSPHHINLVNAIEAMRRNNVDGLILDQIRKDGVGSDLFAEAALNDGDVRSSALVAFCYAQTHGLNFILQLAKTFERVDLLEQCGNFFKLRVPREDKTIGFLFGMIE